MDERRNRHYYTKKRRLRNFEGLYTWKRGYGDTIIFVADHQPAFMSVILYN